MLYLASDSLISTHIFFLKHILMGKRDRKSYFGENVNIFHYWTVQSSRHLSSFKKKLGKDAVISVLIGLLTGCTYMHKQQMEVCGRKATEIQKFNHLIKIKLISLRSYLVMHLESIILATSLLYFCCPHKAE